MMKKFIICLLAAFILLPSFNVHVLANDMGISFDASENILQISGNVGNSEHNTVTVHISKYTDVVPVFSVQNPPLASYLLFTKQNGVLSENIPLSSNFRNNKYSVHFYAETENGERFYKNVSFIFFNPESDEALETINDLNEATSEETFMSIILNSDNALTLGIDLSKITEHSSYAASLSYNLRKTENEGEYTPISFYNTFLGSVAASIIKNSGDVPVAVTSYYSQLGTTVEEYSSLPAFQKEVLNSLLKIADYSQKPIADIFTEKLAVSTLKSSDDREGFKTILLEKDVFGISESDSVYLKIPISYRNLVFSDMYREKNGYTSASDVLASFKKNTAAILKSYGNSDPNSSAGLSPSSAGSSVSVIGSNQNLLTPKEPLSSKGIFSDIDNHWARESVEALALIGAISGFPDGTFKPDSIITRSQFAHMIYLAFDLKGNTFSKFNDVYEGDWFFESVNTLASLDLVAGYNSLFAPNDNIKREDAALVLYRLCNYIKINLQNSEFSFKDSNDINEYAVSAVSSLASSSLLNGENDMFYPTRPLSRAEAATIICRTYNILKGGISQ